jgi:hypothetical protein
MLCGTDPLPQAIMEVDHLRFAESVLAQVESVECPVFAGGQRLVEELPHVPCNVGCQSARHKNKDLKLEGRENLEEDLRICLPDQNMFHLK